MKDWINIEDGLPDPFLKVRVSDGSGSYSIAMVDHSDIWYVDERDIKVEMKGIAKIKIAPENIRLWRLLH